MTPPAPLSGLTVLELSTGVPGGYCAKLLRDAGAYVVKAEPSGGDPLRRGRDGEFDGTPAPGLTEADAPLFRYLAVGKHLVPLPDGDGDGDGDDVRRAVADLAAGADVLVEDGRLPDPDLAALRARNPGLVVVSLTPYGRDTEPLGPATEFTLQARCGSTGGRGLAGTTPLQAGGHIGEWVTGGYAAVAALAAALAARRTGHGDHADVSMLECMASTMQTYGSVTASLFRAAGTPFAGGRTLEIPSIEPTADGWVGFCLGTGQQLQDFLLMIERPDLIDDPRFATMGERARHRNEFLGYVREWTTKQRTADVVALAGALRIPVADVGTPSTLTGMDHFVARGVFVPNPVGGFAQPRVPYRIGGFTGVPFDAAPSRKPRVDTVHRQPPSGTSPELPLAGLRVLDLTAFWAGPSATLTLAALGADVLKVESPKRPDGMRFASARKPGEPQWWEWGMVYFGANPQKRAVTLDLATPEGHDLVLRLAERADVVIENFSPRVLDNLGLTWHTLHERNERLVLLRMPAFGLDGPWRDRTGFAQTMEQISGMAWATGAADGPPLIPRGPCDPNAGTHAVFALLAALAERDRTGVGTMVEATMVEATLNIAAEALVTWTATGRETRRAGNRGPGAAPQGVYRCAGDDTWLALAVETDTHWAALVELLDVALPWSGTENHAERRAAEDPIDAALAACFATRDAGALEGQLRGAGIPAAVVVPPAGIADDPQLARRGFLTEVTHPVTGPHRVPGLPFRLASAPGPWLTRAAPTLGEHNTEVLCGELGLSEEDLAALEAKGIVGTTPG
ncbi:CaiB/BaiF CoA-transferase family protein [Yinghuangia seranimata]|uniref:CaiB/BaiF CoA-transferase family protein n=1 Tax=Yinghuangia seranimata TaxID=408067 RepID=UPI00248BA828|nr:CoA transferase [Yinghuangia seranimata]MDI2126054.1 CoA transferase [Yinghuangia seranimata]